MGRRKMHQPATYAQRSPKKIPLGLHSSHPPHLKTCHLHVHVLQNTRKYPAQQVRGSSAKYDTYPPGAPGQAPTPAPSLAQPVPEALLSGLLTQHLSPPASSTPGFLPNGAVQVRPGA